MLFIDQAKSDVAAFLDEFGEAATFDGTKKITVIFDNPIEPILDIETGGVMIAGPQAMARTDDVPSSKGKTLSVGDISYKIIEAQDDRFGMTTLKLSKD